MRFKEEIILEITQDDIDVRTEYMSEFEILANYGNVNTRDFNDMISENIKPDTRYRLTVEEL